jgi:hypothetical protein
LPSSPHWRPKRTSTFILLCIKKPLNSGFS